MRPLLVTSGEPAGVGPDLCLALADYTLPLVVVGDIDVLQARAQQLGKSIHFIAYQEGPVTGSPINHLTVLSIPCQGKVTPGELNAANASYVMDMLTLAAQKTGAGEFSALITAPVHKAIMNEAGFPFTGHTEFFANFFHSPTVVMMLACQAMRVALVTTHLPLRAVPDAITKSLLESVLHQVHQSLVTDYGIANPSLCVAGLNPHAGENGYLGCEEQAVIIPTLTRLQKKGMHVRGPFPADTMYIRSEETKYDAYVAMYHDQGLPVIKYADFHHAVNVTLGLPIVRASVDHGTALDLAGTPRVATGSLFAAVEEATTIVKNRMHRHATHQHYCRP